jgi:hypothetical protein
VLLLRHCSRGGGGPHARTPARCAACTTRTRHSKGARGKLHAQREGCGYDLIDCHSRRISRKPQRGDRAGIAAHRGRYGGGLLLLEAAVLLGRHCLARHPPRRWGGREGRQARLGIVGSRCSGCCCGELFVLLSGEVLHHHGEHLSRESDIKSRCAGRKQRSLCKRCPFCR